MGYMTVREAAQKWKLSQKQIRCYCANGMIQDAVKISGVWAIPDGAEKPEKERASEEGKVMTQPELKKTGDQTTSGEESGQILPLPLINASFEPGHCLDTIEQIEDPRLKDIAMAEYFYFSGRPEEATQKAELYLSCSERMLRLSACLLYAYANLSIGQIHRVRYALAEIRRSAAEMNEAALSPQRASVSFIVAAAAVLLHLPLPQEADVLQEQIRLLPPGLRMFALYVQAHYTYLQGEYGKSIGIVETAFAMQTRLYPIPVIYLHLVAVMDYMSLKQPEQAQEHLLAAWELARPDDLIEGFGEHHGLLGGMLEAVLKRDWPEDFRRMIAITYRFSAGWRKVHNPVTGHDVADNLTTTEFATAMLAARGWTNQEIANHMGISPNTVKQYISTTLQKLNIKQRKELKQYMLR